MGELSHSSWRSLVKIVLNNERLLNDCIFMVKLTKGARPWETIAEHSPGTADLRSGETRQRDRRLLCTNVIFEKAGTINSRRLYTRADMAVAVVVVVVVAGRIT